MVSVAKENYNSRIIIACDFASESALFAFLKPFKDKKLFLKLGMELIYASGFGIIGKLKKLGHNIFLDLKLHDITNTVAQAIRALNKYRVDFLTVHLFGGASMLSAAQEVVSAPTKLLGVTVLTSMNDNDLRALNITKSMKEEVIDLIHLASQVHLAGVVCSAQEVSLAHNEKLMTITPGIRLEGDDFGDQKRVLTPEAAIKKGTDFLVIGRSITQAKNPYETYLNIERMV